MYSGKINLTNPQGTPFAVSNDFKDQYLLSEAVAECNSAAELLDTALEYRRYRASWSIDADNAKYTRLASKDGLGNIHYFIAYKDRSSGGRLANVSDEELIAELERRGYYVE